MRLSQFNYLSQPLSGDVTIIARVVTEQNLYQTTKAGVMIRETTDPSSAFAFVSLAPTSGGVFFSTRASGAGPNYNGAYSATAPAAWVKLVRQGNTFSGYYSSDGSSWTAAGSSFTVSMATNVLVGLAVVSTYNAALTTAAFDNVSITAGIGVSVSPTSASLSTSQTQQFSATVTNTRHCGCLVLESERGLDLNSGVIHSTVQYHFATNGNSDCDHVADTTKSASATVTLGPPPVPRRCSALLGVFIHPRKR